MLFGDHPTKMERNREDLHGPCERMTRANREEYTSSPVLSRTMHLFERTAPGLCQQPERDQRKRTCYGMLFTKPSHGEEEAPQQDRRECCVGSGPGHVASRCPHNPQDVCGPLVKIEVADGWLQVRPFTRMRAQGLEVAKPASTPTQAARTQCDLSQTLGLRDLGEVSHEPADVRPGTGESIVIDAR